MNRLKREHAIETGVIERLYDLKKGITEPFIKKGFVESYLSHDDTNVPTQVLMKHLKDHLDAVDFVFDVVKDNRYLSTSFIKELHQLVTRHQGHAEGRDGVGNKLKIQLLEGDYKKQENNPTREDGTLIRYCPPEMQTPMRGGLKWMDVQCLKMFEKTFIDCTSAQRLPLIDLIAYPLKAKPEYSQGVKFFSLMRNLTLTGFYTTQMGFKDLGYLGNTPNNWEGVPKDVLDKYGLSYE